MLHDNRDRILSIRLSDQEYADLQNFVYENHRLPLSTFTRILLLSYLHEEVKDPFIYE